MTELTQQQQRRLQKLAKLMDDGNLAILEHLFEIEDNIDEKINTVKEDVKNVKRDIQPNLQDILDQVKGKPGDKGDKGDQGEKGNKGEKGDKGDRGGIGPIGPQGEKGERGLQGKKGDKGEDGKNGNDGNHGSPDTGKEIVEKINALEVEPEKQIDAKHIKNLDKYVGKGNTVYLGPGNSGGGRIIKVYDLSASLDGVTRTFSLPAFWRIVLVQLSSVPVLRPTTDYTISGFQITFTSEVSLNDLSTGQSCIILYAEP